MNDARTSQEKSIGTYRKLNMKPDFARCLGILGDVLNKLELGEKSIEAHEESLGIYKELNMQEKVAIELIILSIPYYYLEKLDTTVQTADEAIHIASKLNNQSLLEQIKNIKERYTR